MKVHPQIINKGRRAEFVVLPINEYNEIISLLEDQQDLEIINEFAANPQELYPLEVVEQLLAGEHPVKVFREYRKLTQSSLAIKANISKQYISQIEKFERNGTEKTLTTIAKILDVEPEDLKPAPSL